MRALACVLLLASACGGSAGPAGPGAHALPPEPRPPLPADVPATFRPVTFETLAAGTRYDPPRSVIGEGARALDGAWVEIVGYMVPLISPEDLSRFVLITQPNVECFFCQPAEMPRTVEVRLAEGVAAEWGEAPVRVRGRLAVGETEGEIALFRLLAVEVEEVDGVVL